MRRKALGTGLIVGVFLTGVGGCGSGGEQGPQGPVDFRFSLPDGAVMAYVAEYAQDVALEMGGQPVDVGRQYGARYTFTGSGAAGSGDVGLQGSVRLDSLGIAVTTQLGRQAFDTRQLVGDEFTITVAEKGGVPEYAGEVPALDLGPMLGGEVAVTLLMNYAFPHLPEHPVSVGDTWTGTITRAQVEGSLLIHADLTAEYAFAGWETVGGVQCAKIEAQISGGLAGAAEQHGLPFEYSGTFQGTATWLFDPVSGSLVEMNGEESTEGVITSSDGGDPGGPETGSVPVQQHTTVRIRSASGA